ncbi:MAG: zinc ribbon domain-containing protein [Acidobacteria bacterium]|nr:zinc ribbon domain-containing protein [Acidobacteriota bacterium]
MFCPNCGRQQVSNEARFCPACGFQLEVVGELVASGGRLHWRPQQQQAEPQELSPRQKGIRQGAFLMLSTVVVVPVVIFLGVALLHLPGVLIPLASVVCVMGGLLRMLYAQFFESNFPAPPAHAPSQPYVPPPAIPNYLGTPPQQQSRTLPPRQAAPVPAPARPQRYNTGELVEPPRASVTDHTTRLLDKQPEEPTRLLDRQPDESPRQ